MDRFLISACAVVIATTGTVTQVGAGTQSGPATTIVLEVVQSDRGDSLDSAQEVRESVADSADEAQEAAKEAAAESLEAAEEAREAAEEAREAAREAAEEAREEAGERSCHHGGAGVLASQLVWFDKDPLHSLARKDRDLRLRDFDFAREPTLMVGIMGNHESPCGFRGGMSLWAGYNSFESAEYPVDEDTATHDSITILRFVPVYGGFNFDKVFHLGRLSLSLGGMVGGGAHLLFMREYDVDESAAFVSMPEDSMHARHDAWGFAWAPMMTAEARAGATVELAPAFHIGLDGLLLMNYSPEGFDVATGNFFSVNPGVRLRLVFGKA